MNRLAKLALLLLLPVGFIQANTLTPTSITIPGPAEGKKIRNAFVEDLLRLVFKSEGYSLTINYDGQEFSKGRTLRELKVGSTFDLNWFATSGMREHELRAIRIPIYQGLIGWRVLLIREADREKFSKVKSLEQLKSYIAVQRFDWADYDVLEENGLNVQGSLSFKSHSLAVKQGVADYFPRSVLEADRELKALHNHGLIIEPNLLLKYPLANYFFVNKKNEALAETIENGFERILLDGRYDELFTKHFGETLSHLKLKDRKVISLTNSQFQPLPYKPHYWYTLK